MGRFEFGQGITSTPGATLTQYNAYAFLSSGHATDGEALRSIRNDDCLQLAVCIYVRDRWQITPKLTLSLGLRYELFRCKHRRPRRY